MQIVILFCLTTKCNELDFLSSVSVKKVVALKLPNLWLCQNRIKLGCNLCASTSWQSHVDKIYQISTDFVCKRTRGKCKAMKRKITMQIVEFAYIKHQAGAVSGSFRKIELAIFNTGTVTGQGVTKQLLDGFFWSIVYDIYYGVTVTQILRIFKGYLGVFL